MGLGKRRIGLGREMGGKGIAWIGIGMGEGQRQEREMGREVIVDRKGMGMGN